MRYLAFCSTRSDMQTFSVDRLFGRRLTKEVLLRLSLACLFEREEYVIKSRFLFLSSRQEKELDPLSILIFCDPL